MSTSYVTVYAWGVSVLGVALLSAGFCFASYRAAFVNRDTRVSADSDSTDVAQAVVFLYGAYLLPWLGVLHMARHFMICAGTVLITPFTLCVQVGLLLTFFVIFWVLA